MVLVVVPWTTLWESNYLLAPHPAVQAVVLSAFARGAVSGLGVVNLLIALHEAREQLKERDR